MYSMRWTLCRGDDEIDGKLRFEAHAAEPETRFYPGCPAYAEILGFADKRGNLVPLTDCETEDRETQARCLEYADGVAEAAREQADEIREEERREKQTRAAVGDGR